MNYHFFDHTFQNFSSDLFSVSHIVFIVLSFLLVPTVSILIRKTNHKKIDLFLKIYSIFIAVLEISKITFSSHYDIVYGGGFSWGGILPLYTCSLFIYTMLFAAWGKGKAREYSLSFITTISLVCGGIGVVYCNGLNFYPFWTFGAFYSLIFHLSMFAVGMFLLISGYKKLSWIDCIKAWVPMLILSLIATPLNYEYHADYMQIYDASGVPLLEDFASFLASHHFRFVFTIIMLSLYIVVAGIVVLVYKLIELIVKKSKKQQSNT